MDMIVVYIRDTIFIISAVLCITIVSHWCNIGAAKVCKGVV